MEDEKNIEITAVVLTADEPTRNGRIYPRSVIEREIARLKPDMEKRRLMGWPADASRSSDSLGEVSHLVTDMKLEDDGRVTAQVEVLKTKNGEALKRLLGVNGDDLAVRFAPRGYGSVKDGVVQDDFRLRSIDVDLGFDQER